MRNLLLAITVGTLALLTVHGCSDPPASIRASKWDDLRRSDISCIDGVHVTADYYDLDGDGRDEAFLTMRCAAKTDPPGDQLEVVPGGADPATVHPTKLVLQMPRAVVDHLCFTAGSAIYRVTVAGESKVWQIRWPEHKPAPSKPTPGPPDGCP